MAKISKGGKIAIGLTFLSLLGIGGYFMFKKPAQVVDFFAGRTWVSSLGNTIDLSGYALAVDKKGIVTIAGRTDIYGQVIDANTVQWSNGTTWKAA